MIEALREHLAEGWSVTSFSGKHNISNKNLHDILNSHPEMDRMRNEYNQKKKRERRLMQRPEERFKYDA